MRLVDLAPISTIAFSPGDLQFSPDGRVLWMCGNEGIKAFQVSDGAQLFASTHPDVTLVSYLAVSPNNATIAFARRDGTTGLFNNPLR